MACVTCGQPMMQLDRITIAGDVTRLRYLVRELHAWSRTGLIAEPLRDRLLAPYLEDVALAERYLAGARDIEVAVIGNASDPLELYGPGEIVPGHEFYDYAAKYTPGLSRTTITADVPSRLAETMKKLARDTYRACGCDGFARIDFLLAGDTLVVSEINTIPGFTPISLFPTMPAAGGYDFGAVCSRVIDLALARDRGRVRRRLTPADLPR
jgi:hypothetical protein